MGIAPADYKECSSCTAAHNYANVKEKQINLFLSKDIEVQGSSRTLQKNNNLGACAREYPNTYAYVCRYTRIYHILLLYVF